MPIERIIGYSIQETLPEDIAAIVMSGLQEAHEKGISNGKQFRMTVPAGSLWFEMSVSCKGSDSNQPRFIILGRDITVRKQMEEKLIRTQAELEQNIEMLERTGEMAKVGGWELDLETSRVMYSKETACIHEVEYPYIPPKLSQGNQYYPPEAWPIIQAAVQAAIEYGTAYDLESPFITEKGRHIWVRVQGFAVKENGKTTKLRGTFQDITERKQTELALQTAEKQD